MCHYTNQDQFSSDYEEEIESNTVGLSSEASHKKRVSNKKQKKRGNATDLQNEASLLDNDELDELLNELPVEDNYAATLNSAIVDYFNDIDQSIATEEALTDQQIVTLIQNEERDDIESDSDDSDEEPSEVSIQEAYSALKTWVTFFEQQQSSNFDMDDIKIFKKYDKITNRMLLDSQKQTVRIRRVCR
ncbi:13687_t:CDS:2 [Racocetra fulgida]|uniref:13687_t:CDS:1 n=2 Tax=Gigasporaceae TaxID=36753 RepID=A0A9N8ZDY1_9GLOM|nr:13687_t:CDS:2 [Racocetra fulgida]